MSKEKRPWAEMAERCSAVLADLAPSCERIEPAGSLRRHTRECGDLEIVCIARTVPAGLFGTESANALYLHLKANEDHYRFLKGDNPTGRYFQLALPDGTQVDLFTAEEDNWGLQFLIRTGSADFSKAVLTRWKMGQGIGVLQPGCVDGRLVTRSGSRIETPEESHVFAAIGVREVPPERRSDGSALVPR